ncbi:MAG TPA: helix-turn-helix transcriptional regulator [Ktedonobacterales bacterium]
MDITRQELRSRLGAGGRPAGTVQSRLEGIEHAPLGLLRQYPMHAYEMYQQLLRGAEGQALARVWRLKQSHLYALLARLEANGYLAGTTETQGTRPPRRVLRLTPAGDAAFAEWVVAPVHHGRDFRLEFLAKLYFAEREGPATVKSLLTCQREACALWLVNLNTQADELGAEHRFDKLVLQFRVSQIEAILGWLNVCAASDPLAGLPTQ